MDSMNVYKLPSDVEATPTSEIWFSIARQRLAAYHAMMVSSNTPRSSERFEELSRTMRNEARVLAHLSKLFTVQWQADAPGINSLPVEILDTIFSIVAEIDRPHPPYECGFHDADEIEHCRLADKLTESLHSQRHSALGSGGSLGWLRLGHVCQTWREVLLRKPALWASDVGLLPRAMDVMLDRSQNMPLTIRAYITVCRPEGQAVLDAMVAHSTGKLVQRARELDIIEIHEDRDVWHDGIDTLLRICTFPVLEHMAVYGYDDYLPVKPVHSLPPIRAPRLRSLRLVRTFYPWTSTVLTSLSVGDAEYWSQDLLTEIGTEHLAYILQTSASTLETLSLSGCSFGENDDHALETHPTTDIDRITSLPNLRSLRIHAVIDTLNNWDVCSWVLASVRLPATAKLVVFASQFEGNGNAEVESIVAVLSTCIAAKEACDINGLCVTSETSMIIDETIDLKLETITFDFYSDVTTSQPVPCDAQDDVGPKESRLSITFEYLTEDYDDIVCNYLDALTTVGVLPQMTKINYTSRSVLSHPEHYSRTFSFFLGASTNVVSFSLRDINMVQDASGENDWVYFVEMLRGPVLPRLKYLTLHEVVDPTALPDILGSRMRSFGEVGQAIPKLRELRVNLIENRAGSDSEQGEGTPEIPAALYEFGDSVVLSRM